MVLPTPKNLTFGQALATARDALRNLMELDESGYEVYRLTSQALFPNTGFADVPTQMYSKPKTDSQVYIKQEHYAVAQPSQPETEEEEGYEEYEEAEDTIEVEQEARDEDMGVTETQGAFADLVPRSSEKRRARPDDVYDGPHEVTPSKRTSGRGTTAPRARTGPSGGRDVATRSGRVAKAAPGRGRRDSKTMAAPKVKPGHTAEYL